MAFAMSRPFRHPESGILSLRQCMPRGRAVPTQSPHVMRPFPAESETRPRVILTAKGTVAETLGAMMARCGWSQQEEIAPH